MEYMCTSLHFVELNFVLLVCTAKRFLSKHTHMSLQTKTYLVIVFCFFKIQYFQSPEDPCYIKSDLKKKMNEAKYLKFTTSISACTELKLDSPNIRQT